MSDSQRSVQDDSQFQIILAECLEILERGESLDREAILRQHPQYATQLSEFLDDHALLRGVATDARENPLEIEATQASGSGRNAFVTGESIQYIGEYRILGEIARGGMGVVFKAKQRQLKRIVALKMILAGRLANEADVQRFRREAQAAARLRHPNIVPVHEVGEFEGHHYFTMDFIEGRSMAAALQNETLAPERAAEIIKTIAEAVHYAHQQGTLHRDLKPANIILDAADQPHITDFGLAKIAEDDPEESSSELTATGQVLGTPSYMSPEQAAGKHNLVGPATDIYALGAVLYACLSGRAPFVADSPVDTIFQVLRNEPVAPRALNPSVPKDIETICLKCLNKEPHKRYGTAEELAEDLGNFIAGRPVQARPIGRTAKTFRWAKRNPVVATLVLLVAFSLFGGTVVASYFAVEANDRAIAERKAKERQAELRSQAEQLSADLEDALKRQRELLQEAVTARKDAESARDAEATARAEAETSLANERAARRLIERREREARWNEYVARMTVMRRPWEEGEMGQLTRMVADIRPEENQPDFRGWEWNYYQDQSLQAARNIPVSRDVRDIAWNPDQTRLATVGSRLEIWDATSHERIYQSPRNAHLRSVEYSPDGTQIAVGYGRATIEIVAADTGKSLRRWEGHEGGIWSLSWSPKGDRLATGSGDSSAKIWNAKTGELLFELMPVNNSNYLREVDWHPSEERVATSHRDGYVRVFNTETGEREFSRRACGISCNICEWSPDGETLAGGGAFPNYDIILYSKAGESGGALSTHARCSAWSPDGKRFASGDDDHDIKIWNVETRTVERTLRFHFAPVANLDWSPDGAYLASAAADGTARVWKIDSNVAPAEYLYDGDSEARTVAYSPDGRWIAGGFADRKIRVWDAQTRELVKELAEHTAGLKDLSWSSDSRHLVAICSDNSVWLWDVESGEARRHIKPKLRGGGVHPWVAWQPHSNAIALGEFADATQTYHAETGERLDKSDTSVSTGRWSHSGRLLAMPGITVVGSDMKRVAEIKLTGEFAYRVAWSPNDRLIAAAGEGGRLFVVDVVDQQILQTAQGHGDRVISVAWQPGSRRIASGGEDGTLKVWDAATLDEVWGIKLKGRILSLDWSPDGRHLVSSSTDGKVQIWGSPQMPSPIVNTTNLDTPIARLLGNSDRDVEVAKWVLEQGGSVMISHVGESLSIQNLENLPSGNFSISEVNMEGVQTDAEELSRLYGLASVAEINLRGLKISDAEMLQLVESIPHANSIDFDASARHIRIDQSGKIEKLTTHEEDLAALSEQIEATPDDLTLLRDRIALLEKLQRWLEAHSEVESYVELSPNDSWRPVRGLLLANLNNAEESKQQFAEKSLKIAHRDNLPIGTRLHAALALSLTPDMVDDYGPLLELARTGAQGQATWSQEMPLLVLLLRTGQLEELQDALATPLDEKEPSSRRAVAQLLDTLRLQHTDQPLAAHAAYTRALATINALSWDGYVHYINELMVSRLLQREIEAGFLEKQPAKDSTLK